MFWLMFSAAVVLAVWLGWVLRGVWTKWREYKRWDEFERNAWQTRAHPGGRS